MPTSLFSPETQAIFDRAAEMAGRPGGPFASPADWRDQSIYFIIVDRFNNPKSPPRQRFNDPRFEGFQGGKFSGIKDQLGYIKDLGAGAIWLSPVLKNLQAHEIYHGYGIHDFSRAEPRFADNASAADDELHELVKAAHDAGLYVILDIVLNHTGDVFAYECDADDQTCNQSQGSEAAYRVEERNVLWRDSTGVPRFASVEDISNPSPDAFVWPKELQKDDFFRKQGTNRPNDTIGDFASLKQMLTEDPDLQRFLIRAYQYVVARYDIDGFRIDTLRYLKGDLPRLFGNAIREFALSIGKKNFFTFGEVWDRTAEEDIARFIGRNTKDQSELVGVDAAMDYPLIDALKPVVKGSEPPWNVVDMYRRRKLIEEDILSSHGDATRFFVTFLDNHDAKERFRYVDPRYVDPANEQRFDDQVTLALACLYALPGIPCLYYGTEQGLDGHGSDPAVREALWGGPGFSETSFFYREIKKITTRRNAEPALRYGRFYFRPVSGDGQTFEVSRSRGGVLAFSRILNDQEVIVVANTSTEQGQSVDVILEIALSQENAPYGILYSNQSTPTDPSPVRKTGTVIVHEVDGSIGNGPLHVLRVTLRPMEVQIIRSKLDKDLQA
jgi:glycosidase